MSLSCNDWNKLTVSFVIVENNERINSKQYMDVKITRKVLHNLMNIEVTINITRLIFVLKLKNLKVRIKVTDNINKQANNEVIITHFIIDLCSLLSL